MEESLNHCPKTKCLLIGTSFLELSFGLPFLFFAPFTASLMGAQLTLAGLFIGRLFGLAISLLGFISWFARNDNKSIAGQVISHGFMVYHPIVAGLVVYGLLTNIGKGILAWIAVAAHLMLFLGFVYALLLKKEHKLEK